LRLARHEKATQFLGLHHWEDDMTAFNIVRFRVKPGHEQHFIAAHRGFPRSFRGFRGGALVKTGEQTFCIIGEWASVQALVKARPQMIGALDSFRNDLEDLGGGFGVTDPVSGDVVLKLAAAKKPRAKSKASAKAAKHKKRR
jgi:hypothetical protein